jgi:hypothetical protein
VAADLITHLGWWREGEEWCKDTVKAVLMKSADLRLPSLIGASTSENKINRKEQDVENMKDAQGFPCPSPAAKPAPGGGNDALHFAEAK